MPEQKKGYSRPIPMYSLPAQRMVLFLLLAPVVAIDAACGMRLHELARRRTGIKEDYSQINSFKYGILSVDKWKSIVQRVVSHRIRDFKFSKDQEAALKFETTKALNVLIAEVEKKL